MMLRTYATVAGKKPPILSRLRGRNALSLEHFIQRQRALALWREILRSTASIADDSTRKEMRHFARVEFEQHKNVTDLGHIRYLISTGKTQFDTMKTALFNSGILR
ncbi:hypothetical protein GQ43DRAFT_38692 [Delitschia confertaspora ATCC 74209]|uniref:LYR motif-containing protein 2 n=1 Tax=Delitschia confertaspora ATCC 74209 TaxID=1513339 RepID=A0A9P4JRP8_9PLEO|nr:hypothetical protein GQ43DRAFT_38692 [Delitschia confertaspora ATCC 74209]